MSRPEEAQGKGVYVVVAQKKVFWLTFKEQYQSVLALLSLVEEPIASQLWHIVEEEACEMACRLQMFYTSSDNGCRHLQKLVCFLTTWG